MHSEDDLEGIFEERAEYLSKHDLLRWVEEFPGDDTILKSLRGPGAKLLIGPRGSGKSTFLKRAYYDMLDSDGVLPIYINYSKSLALEPLFSRSATALALFRQWVLLKILLSLKDSLREIEAALPAEVQDFAEVGERFINDLERGEERSLPSSSLGPSRMVKLLESTTTALGRKRCVLLMDDAAHAFSSRQQREFFEIFRELRTRNVAPKAAVYPGITDYSPYFHAGHEGKLVTAWGDVDNKKYRDALKNILVRRIPEPYQAQLAGAVEIVDALAFASFGLPRGFLNMIGNVLLSSSGEQSITWSHAREAIRINAEEVRGIFMTLSGKLPRYRDFVDMGRELEGEFCKHLREYNKNKEITKKAVAIGLKEPLSEELTKVVSFLEYAGLLRRYPAPISRGVKGRFQRFALHYSVVISEGVLSLGKGTTAQNTAEALEHRDAHAFPKVGSQTLLGDDFDARCTVRIPPCRNCGSERIIQDALFCHICGAELVEASIYHEALNASIDVLPITEKKRKSLLQHNIKSVKDVYLAETSELRKIKGIGAVWAGRIKTAAEEHVSV